MQAFSRLENRMDLKDFTLLANAYRIKLHDFAVMKFDVAKALSKYFSVSAPGEAGPSLKQSYLKLTVLLGLFRRRATSWPARSCRALVSSSALTSRSRRRRSRTSPQVILF